MLTLSHRKRLLNAKIKENIIRLLKENGAEIRINKMLHACMIMFDDIAAIILSADTDSERLDDQRQAGIYTTDRVIVRNGDNILRQDTGRTKTILTPNNGQTISQNP